MNELVYLYIIYIYIYIYNIYLYIIYIYIYNVYLYVIYIYYVYLYIMYIYIYYVEYMYVCGPGSSVGIATDYGLDGLGSNPGGDEIFRPSRPGLGPTQPPVKRVPGLSRG